MKICPGCGVEKSHHAYYKDSNIAECKDCFKARMKELRKRKKQEIQSTKDKYRNITVGELIELVDSENITLQEVLSPLLD